MNDTTRLLGSILEVAVLGALINTIYWSGISQLCSMNGITNDVLEQIHNNIQNAHTVTLHLGRELVESIISVSSQAFVDGMREAIIVGSITMVIPTLSAWLVMLVKPPIAETD